MVPVPGVYLGAVARATRRMRLGPLVYLLPLYSPLRLIEEICMLDHLSHGRLEVGVGRGVSPFELKYHKVEHDQSREIFIDAFNCISAGLTTDMLTYSGPAFQLRERADRAAAAAAAASGVLVRLLEHDRLDLGGRARPAFRHARADADRQGQHRRLQGRRSPSAAAPAQPKAEFPGGAAIGVQRHIFVADTDAEAQRFGKPAMDAHLANINWLRDKHGVRPA